MKKIALLLVVATAFALIAGCSGGAPVQKPRSAPSVADGNDALRQNLTGKIEGKRK